IETVAHNMCDLVGEGRIIVLHTGVGASQNWRLTIHMLGTFTGQRSTTGCCTDDKATSELVSCTPEAIAGPLESEHRVKDVDRYHDLAMSRVRRAGSDHGRGGATFVDTDMP